MSVCQLLQTKQSNKRENNFLLSNSDTSSKHIGFLFENQQDEDSISTDRLLPHKPRSGTIEALGEKWSFQRHGAGVCFEDLKTGKIIDAHKEVINQTRAFDSWRLLQYFESLKHSHIVWNSQKFMIDEEKDLDRLLEDLEREGIVELVSARHKLYELRVNLTQS